MLTKMPSTVTGADYNKVSTAFSQTTNQILNGAVPVEEELKVMESKIKRFTLELFNWRLCESLSLGLRERIFDSVLFLCFEGNQVLNKLRRRILVL
jgi:hypothetical protein